MNNPSLREEPLAQGPVPIPTRPNASILDWLEGSGRLLAREVNERDPLLNDEEIEEINALIIGDDTDFEEDDDVEAEI
ncbi:MAG: DUF3134 domain-containing protein [Aphanocapsa sp. GSE-SYN-MK-11-07L]|jgi:hypothetical protein|nr:DUF3134 domain-containing protein [Aphanocapsa sp. GSE-SYN-MK-11-07L]